MTAHITARPAGPAYGSPVAGRGVRPRHILVVDDDEVCREMLADYLRRQGYVVDGAANGAEAFSAVLCRSYDVVFMDLQMPVMGGEEAMRQIRSLGDTVRQPYIIVLSSLDLDHEFQRYAGAGMNDYRRKPASLRELAGVLRQLHG
jgi:CheY-like chemotaxis protein